MPENSILVSLAQLNFIVGNIEFNTKKIIESITKANKSGTDIILFPELAICSYPPEDLLFRSHFYKQIEKALNNIANSTKNIHVLVGHPYKQNGIYV